MITLLIMAFVGVALSTAYMNYLCTSTLGCVAVQSEEKSENQRFTRR